MAVAPPSSAKLRELLRFDRRTIVDDGMGNSGGPWATLITSRKAQLTPNKGGEQVVADRLQGVAKFTIVVRSDPQTRGITNADRAVDLKTGRVFNLGVPVNLDERDRYLWIEASVGVAEG